MSIIEKLALGVQTTSPEETQSVAGQLANHLPDNQVLKLSGSLGTGKTTFVQGLAKAWSIEESVKSPSFNLYSIYEGQRQLIHVDAYRLDQTSEAEALLIEEFLVPPFCLAIEWPEHVPGWMENDVWNLQFSIETNNDHSIRLLNRPD